MEMNKTIVIYGSSTGSCKAIAEKIADKLNVKALDVQELTDEVIGSHDNLLLGTSTWGAGELQDDWYDGLKVLQRVDLSGKTVAFFGCGDCESYGDSFVSAMGILYDGIKDSGANFIGRTSTDGYNFSYSDAVVDGEFVGLALDDVNEYDKTDERINAWLEVIKAKL